MVSWYKHDIPAWMDGTESLSDGAYRAYHVICQLIYLNEGGIAVNEKGIAGRCNQSIRAFRSNLEELLLANKLTLIDGRLSNARANLELEKIAENRINAGKGGEKSGERRKVQPKPLENNSSSKAPLPDHRSLKDKTREDENRTDHGHRAGELQKKIVKAFEDANSPSTPDTGHVEVWLSQGYDPSLSLAIVSAGVTCKPSIRSLKYFDAGSTRRTPSARRGRRCRSKLLGWRSRRLQGHRQLAPLGSGRRTRNGRVSAHRPRSSSNPVLVWLKKKHHRKQRK